MYELKSIKETQEISTDSEASAAIDTAVFSEPVHGVSRSFLKRFRAWIVLLTLGTVWGLTFSLAKIAAEGGGHPIGIAYWGSLIAAIVLLLFSVVKRRPIPFKLRHIIFYTLCGLLGSAIPNTLFYYAAPRISAGVLSITVATIPLMTFVAAFIFRVEKIAPGRVLGVILGILSIILLVGPEESMPDPGSWVWVMAGVAAALCYSMENMIIAIRIPEGVTAFAIAGGMFLASTVIMTPFMFINGIFVPLNLPWGPVEWSIIAMALVSVFAYGIFVYLIMQAGPVFASQTAYVVTLAGVFWGIVIFGEQHSFWIWISLAVMMTALLLVAPKKKERGMGTECQ